MRQAKWTRPFLIPVLCLAWLSGPVPAAELGPQDIEQARYWLLAEPARAIQLLEPGLQQPLSTDLQVALLEILITAYLDQSQLDQAAAVIDRLTGLDHGARTQVFVAQARGRLAYIQTRYGASEAHLRSALKLGAEQTDLAGRVFLDLANTLRAEGRYTDALTEAQKAVGLLRRQGATAAMADAQNVLGVIFERMGNLEQSLIAHQQALDTRRALQDKSGTADSLYNLGEIYRELGDFGRAEQYLQQSLAIDNALDNRSNRGYGLQKLAVIQCALNKFDEAQRNNLQALALFESLDARVNAAHTLGNLAKLALRQGQFDQALAYVADARSRLPQVPPLLAEQLALYEAKALLNLDRARQAEQLVRATLGSEALLPLAELTDGDTIAVRLALHRLLADSLEAQGQLQQALTQLLEYVDQHDSWLHQQRKQSVLNLQASVDFSRREQQLAVLTLEDKVRAAMAQARQHRLISIVVILLLLLALLAQGLRARVLLRRARDDRPASPPARNPEVTALPAGVAEALELACTQSQRDYLARLQQGGERPRRSDRPLYRLRLQLADASQAASLATSLQACVAPLVGQAALWHHLGGADFLLLAGPLGRDQCAALARQLCDSLQGQPWPVPVKLSVGYVAFPFFADQPSLLAWHQALKLAEQCLDLACRSGLGSYLGLSGTEHQLPTLDLQQLLQDPASAIAEGWVVMTTDLSPGQLHWPA